VEGALGGEIARERVEPGDGLVEGISAIGRRPADREVARRQALDDGAELGDARVRRVQRRAKSRNPFSQSMDSSSTVNIRVGTLGGETAMKKFPSTRLTGELTSIASARWTLAASGPV